MNVTVRVKPGSRKGPLIEQELTPDGEILTVFVQQRAVDGQANSAVVELLAKHFNVPRSRIEIVRGHSSRLKMVRVDR
ncbi:MAG: DUF167 domain-containing protein [Micrococcales bacterium]|nr:DUF167 domain-containing protein [Micrococcales bacterium]